MTTTAEQQNKQYLNMRRRQYKQMVQANAMRFAKHNHPATHDQIQRELLKVASDCPGKPLTAKEIEAMIVECFVETL